MSAAVTQTSSAPAGGTASTGGAKPGAAAGGPAGPAPAGAGAAHPPGAAPAAAFVDQLPEDIRGDAVFKDIKDLGALAKSYVHAQRLIGRDPSTVLPIPGSDDDADGWNGVYAKLGRPEAPEGYKLPDVSLPEGLKEDQALRGAFLGEAHKAGLSNRQASALYAWWNGQQAAILQAQNDAATQQSAATEAALTREWGAAFKERVDDAKTALTHYFPPALIEKVNLAGLGRDAEFVNAMATLGKALREDGVVGRGAGGGAYTPTEAQQQISALQRDPEFMKAYTRKDAPGHVDAVQKMHRLFQMAHPESVEG
jgi:hypothetical protein